MSDAKSPSPTNATLLLQGLNQAAIFSWSALRVFAVFLVGGVFLAFVVDVLVSFAALIFDASGYPNQLGTVVRELLSHLRASPYLAFALLFYVKAQLVNMMIALLSLAVLKRVSFWAMTIAVPIVAYFFGFSFSVDWYWQTSRPELGLTKFFALILQQLLITLTCLVLVRHKSSFERVVEQQTR